MPEADDQITLTDDEGTAAPVTGTVTGFLGGGKSEVLLSTGETVKAGLRRSLMKRVQLSVGDIVEVTSTFGKHEITGTVEEETEE